MATIDPCYLRWMVLVDSECMPLWGGLSLCLNFVALNHPFHVLSDSVSITDCVQWNPSNADTHGDPLILIKGASLFQGLFYTHKIHSGPHVVSALQWMSIFQGCPQVWGPTVYTVRLCCDDCVE